MTLILNNAEVIRAIRVDADYPVEEIEQLADAATSFVEQKSGYKVVGGNVHPLAKQCAILYVRQSHFNSVEYHKEHDYALGIDSLIEDLKDIARAQKHETSKVHK